jgi:hypothetical protein
MTQEQGTPLSDNIIVWTKEDGSVRITQMIDDTIDVDEEIEKISASDPSLTFKFKGKLSETGVAINFFYGALAVDEDDNLAYDMVKARNIWRNILRQLREPKLAALDLAYQRADESGNATLKAEIVAKKNILRDCTADPDIETATSLNDLRRTLPELLAD